MATSTQSSISIHAPREGSDESREDDPITKSLFLSTLPARGATRINTRRRRKGGISIHAPREGSDYRRSGIFLTLQNFYPRSPRGERRTRRACPLQGAAFLSTLPARGATSIDSIEHSIPTDFYPRSPRGERPNDHIGREVGWVFLSTLPARGATWGGPADANGVAISIHAPREGSDVPEGVMGPRLLVISIHAPREGSDGTHPRKWAEALCISIHAPREGSDGTGSTDRMVVYVFLSTLPARGATGVRMAYDKHMDQFLSTLPARGATYLQYVLLLHQAISIHAPREGSDGTHPRKWAEALCISIHAPREGSDYYARPKVKRQIISIHAPREGSDTDIWWVGDYSDKFLSTLPARGATCAGKIHLSVGHISIHAPREGSDPRPGRSARPAAYFYPRSPRGERPKFWRNVNRKS